MIAPRPRRLLLLIPVLIACCLAGCQGTSALNPSGPAAANIANLWWFMFAVASVVYVVTIGILLVALFRRRSEAEHQAETSRGSYMFIIVSGIVIPAIILAVLFVFTLQTMTTLAPPGEDSSLTVDVIGHQWWWEVRYPDQDFETANEIRIPVGERVRIRLMSADVIHSFWVPELHGKTDMIPGRTNTIWIEASETGQYRGICAEFCGLQHAKMQLYVVAENAEDFAAWVEQQQQPAAEPDSALVMEGQQIFLGSACVYCHAIRGTNAMSDLGPDLTHLASRVSLGAGIVPNTRGYLAGWIIDSHGLKPGNYMPPMYLDSQDLNALLAYMDTLR